MEEDDREGKTAEVIVKVKEGGGIFLFFLKNVSSLFYLFVYFWLCWVFISVRGLFL